MRVLYDVTTLLTGQDASHGTLLPGRQYLEEPGTPTEEVCQDGPTLDTLPGGQYARVRVFILVYRLAMDARTQQG